MTSQNEDFSQANLQLNTAHLTDNWGVEVNENEVINYSHECCHTQKEVDLQKVKVNSPAARRQGFLNEGAITTYPDRPPIAAMSLDDTPLKVKSCEELPAGAVLR
jgi:hypothetical protein